MSLSTYVLCWRLEGKWGRLRWILPERSPKMVSWLSQPPPFSTFNHRLISIHLLLTLADAQTTNKSLSGALCRRNRSRSAFAPSVLEHGPNFLDDLQQNSVKVGTCNHILVFRLNAMAAEVHLMNRSVMARIRRSHRIPSTRRALQPCSILVYGTFGCTLG